MEVEDQTAQDHPRNVKTLFSFYSNYLWNRLSSLLPTSDSNFLGKISSLSRQTVRASSRRRRTACLPLPLPSYSSESFLYDFSSYVAFVLFSVDSNSCQLRGFVLGLFFACNCRVVQKSSGVYDILEDIMGHILLNLHNVEKNLQFWQCRAEVSKSNVAVGCVWNALEGIQLTSLHAL